MVKHLKTSGLYLKSTLRILKLAAIFLVGACELAVRRPSTPSQRADWLHRFCVRTIRIMGIAVRIEGTFPTHGVVVSNHLGYLDIMAFAAGHRCTFVGKAELADPPIIGWMTTMAGTIYVERGRGGSAQRAKAGLLAAAGDGIPVVLFPEGTTSDGRSVLPFHSGALAQLMQAGLPIYPAFLRYRLTEDNGAKVTAENDLAYWGDKVRMLPHIFHLLSLRGVEVVLTLGDQPIAFTVDFQQRKQAALEARAAVMALGGVREPVPANF